MNRQQMTPDPSKVPVHLPHRQLGWLTARADENPVYWQFHSHDGLPGNRAALPAGTLPGVFTQPQADESREPPPNAPNIPA